MEVGQELQSEARAAENEKPHPGRVIALTLLPSSRDKAAGQGPETDLCNHMGYC